MTYNPGYDIDFDKDFERGKVGEDAVRNLLTGTAEVKTDYRVHETQNLYVEFEQFDMHGNTWPSGISTTTADRWFFVSGTSTEDGMWTTPTKLREVINNHVIPRGKDGIGTQTVANEHTNGSRGYLVPILHLLRYMGFCQ